MILRAIAALLGAGFLLSSSGQEQRTFTSEKFGYKLTVPPGWNIVVSPTGSPIIFNYKQSDALPQGLIPEHGADIYVVPYELVEPVTKAASLQAWIEKMNTSSGHRGAAASRVPDVRGSPEAPHDIVKVESDYQRFVDDDGLQREVNYYFTLKGNGYRLMMVYNKGDQGSPEWEKALEALLQTIRAL